MRSRSTRTRDLGFGLVCLLLAIVATVTASWIPAVILVIVGAVFVGRAVSKR
jgi:hypothetical protein